MAATAVLAKVKAITQDPANVPAALKLGFAKVMVKTIETCDLEESDLLLSLECAKNCAQHPDGLAELRSHSALAPRLDFIANHGNGASKETAAAVLSAVSKPASAAATGASQAATGQSTSRPATAAAKKTKALKVSMKGAMGGKQAQDAYVEAILLLPGVTSVTIDMSKDKIVVYTSAAEQVKPQLAGAIREVRTRFGLSTAASGALGPSAAANTYYGDEDEDEAYEANKKNTITDNAGVETVEARMARKRRARAAAKGGENQGIMGAVASVGSWLWG